MRTIGMYLTSTRYNTTTILKLDTAQNKLEKFEIATEFPIPTLNFLEVM